MRNMYLDIATPTSIWRHTEAFDAIVPTFLWRLFWVQMIFSRTQKVRLAGFPFATSYLGGEISSSALYSLFDSYLKGKTH